MPTQQRDTRKYVDLILQSSSQWASWYPSRSVKVGDYGKVDPISGEFEAEGNIYDPSFATQLGTLKPEPPQQTPAQEDPRVICSENVRGIDLDPALIGSVPGLAEASFKGEWKFEEGAGALLIMYNIHLTRMPNGLLTRLFALPVLSDMSVVTEVVTCPSFAFKFSGRGADEISLALTASAPLPNVPATVGGKLGGSWWSNKSSGTYSSGCDPTGKDSYTPLFTLKMKPKRGIFNHPQVDLSGSLPNLQRVASDLWVRTDKPWGALDDDGREILRNISSTVHGARKS